MGDIVQGGDLRVVELDEHLLACHVRDHTI
jgi:hypothetical protein